MIPLALPGAIGHEFVFRGQASSVHVAGEFNGWSRFVSPMQKDRSGVWRLTLRLPIGRHRYKLVVDDTRWILDPASAESEKDGQGNANSIVSALPKDYASPARRGDGVIATSTLFHQSRAPYMWHDGDRVHISLTLRPGDAEEVTLIAGRRRYAMPVAGRGQWVETRSLVLPGRRPFSYRFEIRDGAKALSYGAKGVGSKALFTADPKSAVFPKWPEGRVLYQIFADRFANGSKANDPSDVQPWDSVPTGSTWLGGDAAGVVAKIPYLKSLGIEAVYFNPLFLGPSSHRYETTDYHRIDPRFGTNEEFASLTRRLKREGIRTVLDGVFNHTSTSFFAFKSLLEQQEESPYRGWYTVRSYPVKLQGRPTYEAWNGFGSMPKVNLSDPEARKHMLGVLDYWQKEASIDGWRLDVAGEVQMDFWREFRARLKSLDPGAWIVGEVWADGSPWLGGDQWDSIMGYQFRDAAVKFIARRESKAGECLDSLFGIYDSYAPPVSRSLMNLLGSHDTPRFLTECGGSADLARLGATLLLTWPGSPSIYYGDELGMAGGPDPDNRRGMDWAGAVPGNRCLAHYRKLIALRRSRAALSLGDPVRLGAWDDKSSFAFGRVHGKDRAAVAINRSSRPQTLTLPLPPAWRSWSCLPLRDALGSAPVTRLASGAIRLTLAPLSGAVVVPR